MDNGRNSLGGVRGANFDSLRPGVGEMDAGAINAVEQLAGRVPEVAQENKEMKGGIFTAEKAAEVAPVEQTEVMPEEKMVVPEAEWTEIGFLDGKKEKMGEAGVSAVKKIEGKMDDPYRAAVEADLLRWNSVKRFFGREKEQQ